MSNYGFPSLEQSMAKYLAGIHAAPAQAPSALNDLDAFIRAIPPDERKAVEADKRVEAAKSALLVSFMDYLLGATPFGNAFCTGAGSAHAQALLDTVKATHREIAGKLESEHQSMQRKLEEQDRVIAKLCEQLGVNDVASL